MPRPGLRELKREATAHALAEAAFDLARARGLDGFVIDDVTERAGYSRRTFANHYSCKEEAVASVAYRAVDEAGSVLAEIPADVPLLDAVERVLKRQLTAEAMGRMRDLLDLVQQHPSLEPYVLSVHHRLRVQAEQQLRSLAAERYPSVYVSLLFGAVYGMVSAALEGAEPVRLPGESAPPGSASLDLDTFLAMVFEHLRNGF